MTGTPQSSQLITSEQVLEKLFRAGYARWLDEAKQRLGADAVSAAPRLVSKVFHLAWNDRQRFTAREELDAFLGANIQHQVARELSRRVSAQRIKHGQHAEAHEHAEMTVDEAWDRLQHTLQGGAPEAYRQRASTARHGAADHMAALGKKRFNWKVLVGVGVLAIVVVVGGYMYVERAGADRAVMRAITAPDARTFNTSYGQLANVTLDDSTIVRLGPETKLSVPKLFNEGLRSVGIDGTASFDVREELDQPFDVRYGDVVITARGTVFVVRKYRDDAALVVHARTGTLTVRHLKVSRNLAEGASLRVDSAGAMSVPSQEEMAEATSWTNGTVSILNHTLRDALPLLKRWYALDIRVQDSTLMSRSLFISTAITSPKDAIAAAEKSGGLTFTYIGDYMAFKDAAPARGRRPAR